MTSTLKTGHINPQFSNNDMSRVGANTWYFSQAFNHICFVKRDNRFLNDGDVSKLL
jgi:hypothetical protein